MSQVWKRTALTAPLPEEDLDLIEVSLFDLAESFFTLMKRKQSREPARHQGQRDLDGRQDERDRRPSSRSATILDFLEYLDAQETLEEALIAFFCLLELIKARLVVAMQEQLFHTIKVWLRKDAPGEGERMTDNLKDILEALIFISVEPLTTGEDEGSPARCPDPRRSTRPLQELVDAATRRPTAPSASSQRRAATSSRPSRPSIPTSAGCSRSSGRKKLSGQALETLSAVAYHQPVTQAEISAIRGVDSTYALHTLLENKLIKIVGRKEAPGPAPRSTGRPRNSWPISASTPSRTCRRRRS